MRSNLSLLLHNDEEIFHWAQEFKNNCKKEIRLIEDSDCSFLLTQNGKFRINEKQEYEAYQIVAFQRYGREIMNEIQIQPKDGSLVIAHICGSLQCITSDHLSVETKRSKDTRHICLKSLKLMKKKYGFAGVRAFISIRACFHSPICGTNSMNNFQASQQSSCSDIKYSQVSQSIIDY